VKSATLRRTEQVQIAVTIPIAKVGHYPASIVVAVPGQCKQRPSRSQPTSVNKAVAANVLIAVYEWLHTTLE
jgi:hypothetical protein